MELIYTGTLTGDEIVGSIETPVGAFKFTGKRKVN